MDEGAALDEDLLQVMLLFFSLRKAAVTDMIFLVFLPVWMTQEPSPSQVENTFNKAPVWQHYYS